MEKTSRIEIIQNQKQTGKGKINPKKILKNKSNIIYTLIILTIFSVALFSYNHKEEKANIEVHSNKIVESSNDENKSKIENISLDKVTESNVVAGLAESANLAVAPSTANLSVSISVINDSNQSTGVVEKPKILEVKAEERKITVYKTKEEETIQSIADKYGITAQTIKWVNNLKDDKVEAGKELKILPIDGIVYTVKENDSIEEIAKKYQASTERISSYNGNEKLEAGKEIVIPGGILPENERPDYTAPVKSTAKSSSVSRGVIATQVPSSNYNAKAGNAYAWGNCTWYVYNRRSDIGSFWGNASSWAISARAAGYRVDSTPTVGAIAQWNSGAAGSSYWGHVGIVESINGDGTITITDMNHNGGLGKTTTRTIPISNPSNYIH